MISTYLGNITIVLKFPLTNAASANGLHKYSGFFVSLPFALAGLMRPEAGLGEDGDEGPLEGSREGVGERRCCRGLRLRLASRRTE